MVVLNDHVAVFIIDILTGISACNTVLQSLYGLLAIHKSFHHVAGDFIPALRTVHLTDDQLLRHIHHSTRQITGVCGTQRGIGHTLPGAVGGHKVLQHVQSLTEIGLDGQLNGFTGGIRHQSTHTCQLFDLLVGTTGAGVRHHKDIVIFIQTCQQHICQFLIGLVPSFHHRAVSLLLGDEAPAVIGRNLIHCGLCGSQHLRLLRGHSHIGDRYGHGRPGGILIADGLHIVQHLCGTGGAMGIDNLLQNLLQLLLTHMEIHFQLQTVLRSIPLHKTQVLGQDLIEQETAQCGFHIAPYFFALGRCPGHSHIDAGVQSDHLVLICQDCLVHILEELAFAQYAGSLLGQVVDTQHHILGGHCHGTAVGRLQQVVG